MKEGVCNSRALSVFICDWSWPQLAVCRATLSLLPRAGAAPTNEDGESCIEMPVTPKDAVLLGEHAQPQPRESPPTSPCDYLTSSHAGSRYVVGEILALRASKEEWRMT